MGWICGSPFIHYLSDLPGLSPLDSAASAFCLMETGNRTILRVVIMTRVRHIKDIHSMVGWNTTLWTIVYISGHIAQIVWMAFVRIKWDKFSREFKFSKEHGAKDHCLSRISPVAPCFSNKIEAAHSIPWGHTATHIQNVYGIQRSIVWWDVKTHDHNLVQDTIVTLPVQYLVCLGWPCTSIEYRTSGTYPDPWRRATISGEPSLSSFARWLGC